MFLSCIFAVVGLISLRLVLVLIPSRGVIKIDLAAREHYFSYAESARGGNFSLFESLFREPRESSPVLTRSTNAQSLMQIRRAERSYLLLEPSKAIFGYRR